MNLSSADLALIKVITIDRVIELYPSFPFGSVPAGAWAGNIYASPFGWHLPGADEEIEVGAEVAHENQLWRAIKPTQTVCDSSVPRMRTETLPNAENAVGVHSYMQYSMLVERKVFSWLGLSTLSGIWDLHFTGIQYALIGNVYQPLNTTAPFVLREEGTGIRGWRDQSTISLTRPFPHVEGKLLFSAGNVVDVPLTCLRLQFGQGTITAASDAFVLQGVKGNLGPGCLKPPNVAYASDAGAGGTVSGTLRY